jgi:hypothetical protein
MPQVQLSRSLVVAAGAVLVLAAGCGGGASTEPAATEAGTTPGEAPCTKEAITAGVEDGAMDPIQGVDQYGCSGNWAYAGVIVGGPNGYEATALLRWEGDAWKSVDRAKPCEGGSVPKDIYKDACETN